MRRIVFSMMVALCCVAPAVTAKQAVDQRRPAAADGRVEIECISGRIVVNGWAEAEIHITGTLGDDVKRLVFEGDKVATRISVELPSRSNHDADADLTIYVPMGSQVEVETVSADIAVNELTGVMELESVSGDVTVASDSPSIEVETVSGEVSLTRVTHLKDGRFQSVSGDLELSGGLAADAKLRFETVSGDVELVLDAGSGAVFDVSTFSGKIRGEADKLLQRAQYGPGASGRLIAGDGGAKVKIETFSGDLKLEAGELRSQQ